jgi:hypothetical protein
VNYLEDQAVAVITNASEMHGSLEAAVNKIKRIKLSAKNLKVLSKRDFCLQVKCLSFIHSYVE